MKPIVITISVVSIEEDSVTLLIEGDLHGVEWDSKEITLKTADWVAVEVASELKESINIGRVQP